VQGFADEFWSKWTKEYMHTLQTRSKWENPTKDLRSNEQFINGIELITAQTSAIKATSDSCESLFPSLRIIQSNIAFRRFIALRGNVKLVRSHRGTNFIGAIQDLGISAEFSENGPVDKTLSRYGTIWKFNPPHASHFDGSWERMIGISRRILDCMILCE
jgi:hypothetical protein